MASLRGHLSTLSVPELLQFLGSNRRTGTLALESGNQRKDVVLQDGSILFCTAGRPKERLGHHVLAQTNVTEAHLDLAFRKQDSAGGRLGELLVGDGRIAQRQLEAVLRSKLEDSVHDLFTWSAGTFEWHESENAPTVPARLDLDWRDALLGGGERADLTRAALERLGDPRSLLRVGSWTAVFESQLEAAERDLVDLAALGVSIEEVCAIRHETDFQVLFTLSWLVGEGMLVVLPHGGPVVEPPNPIVSLTLGRSLLDQARFLEAMDVLSDLARRHPTNADVLTTLRAATAFVRTRVERELGGLGAIPRLTAGATLDLKAHTARERAVLERVNDEWPLASLVRICPLGELETLLVVRSLFRDRIVGLRPGHRVRPLGQPEPEDRPAERPLSRPEPSRLASIEPGPSNRGARRIGVADPALTGSTGDERGK